ncbi:MAG: hypothetical protein V7636_1318 [Actinomycetota bacterium]
MQLSPRYGGAPIITLDGAIDDQRETLARQRRRLLAELAWIVRCVRVGRLGGRPLVIRVAGVRPPSSED